MTAVRPFSALLRSSMTNLLQDADGGPATVLGPAYKQENIKQGVCEFFGSLNQQLCQLSEAEPSKAIIKTSLANLDIRKDDNRSLIEELCDLSPYEQRSASKAADLVGKSLGIDFRTDDIDSSQELWSGQKLSILPYVLANLLIEATQYKDQYISRDALDHIMKYQDDQLMTLTLIMILSQTNKQESRDAIADLLSRPAANTVGTLVYNAYKFHRLGNTEAAASLDQAVRQMAKRSPDIFVAAINEYAQGNLADTKILIKNLLLALVGAGKAGQAKLIELAQTCDSNPLANMAINSVKSLPARQAYDFLIGIVEAPTKETGRDLKHMAMNSIMSIAAEDELQPDYFRLARLLESADETTKDSVETFIKANATAYAGDELGQIIAGQSSKLTMCETIACLQAYKEAAIPLILDALIKHGQENKEHLYIPVLEGFLKTNFAAKTLNELHLQIAHKLIYEPDDELAEHFANLLKISKSWNNGVGGLLVHYSTRLLVQNIKSHPHLYEYLEISHDPRIQSYGLTILESDIRAAAQKSPEEYQELEEMNARIAAQYSST